MDAQFNKTAVNRFDANDQGKKILILINLQNSKAFFKKKTSKTIRTEQALMLMCFQIIEFKFLLLL